MSEVFSYALVPDDGRLRSLEIWATTRLRGELLYYDPETGILRHLDWSRYPYPNAEQDANTREFWYDTVRFGTTYFVMLGTPSGELGVCLMDHNFAHDRNNPFRGIGGPDDVGDLGRNVASTQVGMLERVPGGVLGGRNPLGGRR